MNPYYVSGMGPATRAKSPRRLIVPPDPPLINSTGMVFTVAGSSLGENNRTPSRQEAAAVIAAITQFEIETANAPAESLISVDRWQEIGRLEAAGITPSDRLQYESHPWLTR